MTWADNAIKELRAGREATVRPRGHSMEPKVTDGTVVRLAPVAGDLEQGDVVLVRVRGRVYLHLVKAVQGARYLIGNNKGRINGWVGRGCIYGRAVEVGGCATR